MNALRVIVAVTAIGYVAVSAFTGWDEVLSAVQKVGLFGIGIGLLLTIGNIGLRFMRWQWYLHLLHRRVPWVESLRVFVGSLAVTITPGGAGEPVLRGLYLQRFGVTFPEVFAAYGAERIIDVICVLVLALAGLAAYPAAQPAIALVAAAVLTVVICAQRVTWLRRLHELLLQKEGKIRRFAAHGVEVVTQSSRFFAVGPLVCGLACGLTAWILTAAGFFFLLHLSGSNIALQTAVFAYSFSILVGALSFLPGGLGTAEATMIGILLMNGTQQAEAIAITILTRIVTLWFSVVLGITSLYLNPQIASQGNEQS